ncbi:MAG: hypothetical protein QOF61_2299 [Acidobacteriota bacterium]|nr:hypothetical protein [Acidobacteriota bacterium]
MRADEASATARLIAESTIFLAGDASAGHLIPARAAELSTWFVESPRQLARWAIQSGLRRKFARFTITRFERLILPGIQLHYALRKRYLEDAARAALDEGIRQVVVFGAGFDTLALRLAESHAAAEFFELDHPATQAQKTRALKRRAAAAPRNLHFLPLDLACERPRAALLHSASGYRADAPTLFVAEGLTMYLSREEVETLFAFARAHAGARSLFAFTYMEPRADGRVGFRASSPLVGAWLRWRGEVFKWGARREELCRLLAAHNFEAQEIATTELLRRRYLAPARLAHLRLAEGESLCVARLREDVRVARQLDDAGDERPGVFVNDVHSRLNRTRVSEISEPASIEALRETVRRARRESLKVCVAGGRHAMGGQQFGADCLLVDMRRMNGVVSFDPARGVIEVGTGIQWTEMIAFMTKAQRGATRQVGIRQKQTGADNLSVGGALAANVHGRGLRLKPFIGDVESFTLVDAEGDLRECSRTQNAELFRLVAGGYGLFGIVTSVKLRLAPRRKLERVVRLADTRSLTRDFDERIRDGYLYGDFQFKTDRAAEGFLREGIFACYRSAPDEAVVSEGQKELSADDWRELLYLAHADRRRAFEVYAAHYLATSGQIYWSDTHQLSVYLDDYHRALDARLNARVPASEMITEVYVPRRALAAFLETVRTDFLRHNVELIYGTIRLIERDEESFLAWAREAFACVVFNLHVEHDAAGREKAQRDFRRLIARAVESGGSFYLTYHRWATREQVLSCYPQMPEFLRLKKRYDPSETFESDWYRHYREMFADELTH